jgi:FG-GAP-like repeat/FG-GAP repeat
MHSDCPFNYFSKKAAFCQYKPPVGKFTPKVEWTWTGSKTALTNHFDVLAPPVVVHLTDDNKDGKLGVGDIPDIVVVTYPDITNHTAPILRDGVLRALSGETGKELWSVTAKTQRMIAGASVATGDLDGDGKPEIVGVDANFYIKAFSAAGKLLWTSDQVVASHEASTKPWNGWGGGIGIADLDADGTPEIFFDASVFSSKGKLRWRKKNGGCAAPKCNFGPLSTAANLDGDAKGTLELVAGNKVYSHDGKLLWTAASADGYPAVADFFSDKDPEVILVSDGELYIFDGKTGKKEWGPIKFPYPASGDAAKAGPGGPPTVADFDGDGRPEVGVAGGYYYVVFDPDCKKGATKALCASGATNGILWKKASKDLSSRATGSSVFDFEGDGKAEVVYSDECFLRVYDGTTGKVLFQWSNNTRTATEAPIVADVDGDGRAEIVMVSNRRVWNCDTDYPGSWKKPPQATRKRATQATTASPCWATSPTTGSARAGSGTSTPTTSATSATASTRSAPARRTPTPPCPRPRPTTGPCPGSTTSARTFRAWGCSTRRT